MTGGKGQIVLQDLTVDPEPPVEDESIDVFMTTEVIEHMGREFIEPWIEASARKLRPGGIAYISTPNHDGSNDKLPKDHVYEWGYQELKEELERNFHVQAVTGTFIQIPNFKKAQADPDARWWTDDMMVYLEERFGRQFFRMVAAMFYTERANNCAWRLTKK